MNLSIVLIALMKGITTREDSQGRYCHEAVAALSENDSSTGHALG